MGGQDGALRVAAKLLPDIELKRMKAREIVLKASRVAHLVGRDEVSELLAAERDGYRKSEAKWIKRADRSSRA